MGTITVRNLPDRVIQALKARAKRNGRSMEQEVREILEAQALDRAEILRRIEQEIWPKLRRRPSREEIDSWIQDARNREV